MTNPSLVVPGALQPLLDLTEVIGRTGVPQTTLDLVRLRVSQLNGRVYTFDEEEGSARPPDERLLLVSDWRTESCFTEAERAALALAEALTLLADPQDMAPDEVWEEAARHYTEQELGALVIHVGLVNLWNRVNVATRQEPAAWR